jgi:hypothetical protein
MRYLFLLPFVMLLCSCFGEQRFYREITAEEYSRFKPVDTLAEKPGLLITKCQDKGEYEFFSYLIHKNDRHFKLDSDAYPENDSAFIWYKPAYVYVSGESEFQKDGIWIHAEFTVKKDKIIPIMPVNSIQYHVDSLPPGYKDVNRPKAEGIYFYENNRLNLISKEQSEDAFNGYKKNGFYFIPNSGRLFTRHSINEIN